MKIDVKVVSTPKERFVRFNDIPCGVAFLAKRPMGVDDNLYLKTTDGTLVYLGAPKPGSTIPGSVVKYTDDFYNYREVDISISVKVKEK